MSEMKDVVISTIFKLFGFVAISCNKFDSNQEEDVEEITQKKHEMKLKYVIREWEGHSGCLHLKTIFSDLIFHLYSYKKSLVKSIVSSVTEESQEGALNQRVLLIQLSYKMNFSITKRSFSDQTAFVFTSLLSLSTC